MKEGVLFYEKQKLNKKLAWMGLIGLSTAYLIKLLHEAKASASDKEAPINDLDLAVMAGSMLGMTALLYLLKLETEVTKDSISVRLYPLQLDFRVYRLNEVKEAFIRAYAPLKEYGGWGLRYGWSGKALNISGNKGLQLKLANGKRLLIGTNKSEQLRQVLQQIGF